MALGLPFDGQDAAPWDMERVERRITLRPGFAVVEHSVFCGKDMGLTFYLHPVDAAPMLPAPVELSEHERIVLKATKGLKSSYGGKDRYELARPSSWMPEAERAAFPTRAQWDASKVALIGRGMLNKAGATTVSGWNAVGGL